MRAAANTFLVLFLTDAVLSLTDELLGVTLGSDILSGVRYGVAYPTALAALLVYLALGITPRLPKRIFMPPGLFTLWTLLTALPLPIYLGMAWTNVAAPAIQLGVALLALLLARRAMGGERWLLGDEALAGPDFSARNSLLYFGGHLVLGPLALALYLGLCLSLAVEQFTGGFVHLDPRGFHAEARQYVRGNQQVHLIAMLHIGDRDYYEQALSDLPADDAIVLAEGVTDEQQLMPEGLSYGRLAEQLGLDAQEDVSIDTGAVTIESADVDLSEFSPGTVELLRAISRVLQAESLADAFLAYREVSELTADPEAVSTAMFEIIELRNQRLIEHLDLALESYTHVLVPWGAAHMPAFEEALAELGFELSETRERPVIEF
jgi:hypothetical protein